MFRGGQYGRRLSTFLVTVELWKERRQQKEPCLYMCLVQSEIVVFKAVLHSHRDEVTRIQRMCDPQKESRLLQYCLRWLFCYTSCVVSWPRWSTTVYSCLLWWSGGRMLGGASCPRICHVVVPGQFLRAWCQQMHRDSAELSKSNG